MNVSTLPLKSVVAVVIGNWLEFYDFLVYTFFAVMIGDAFFPGTSEIGRLLGALATFGVGFVTRPIGAAVIGPYADRVGRRAALTLTLLLMSLGSGLVAVTPSYARIGLAAPIVLVIARLIQGFSCGGEVGAATAYLLESAPMHKRAALTAWQGYSQQIAVFVGSLVGVILASTLSKEQLYAWGWRVPFALGTLVAPVGLYIRRQLPETLQAHDTHRSSRAVLVELVQRHSRAVVLGILVICGGTISTYMFNYMATYAITTLHLSATIGTIVTLTGSVAAIAGMAVGVSIDRFGRKPMLIVSRVVFVLAIYPAFRVLTAPQTTPLEIVAVNMLSNLIFSVGIGAQYAFLLEAFPKSVRSSGLGILYAVGLALFGGTTQFAIAWLIDWTKSPMVPAWYLIVANIAAIVGVALLRPDVEVLGERSAVLA
jgi:MFS family permease